MNDVTMWLPVTLAALLSLLAVYYAVAPLLQATRPTLLLDDDKLVELLGRKDAVLQGIKDLEFDYRVGKISDEDYRRLDQRLRRQAIGLIQQIERVAPESASLDEQLESIIAQFRQTSSTRAEAAPTSTPVVSTQTFTAPISPVATAPTAKADGTRFCTECGKPLAANHKFCAHCGTPVAQGDAATQVDSAA